MKCRRTAPRGSAVPTYIVFAETPWSSKLSKFGTSSGGCKIARTEERAISVSQPRDVMIEIDRSCQRETWSSTFDGAVT